MKDISGKFNDIAVAEYIYQLKVSKCIKDNKMEKKDLIKKIEKLIDTKEQIIKNK